ncbi:MAG: hypothetical protein L0K63_13130 [Yaniella sp.]|nr:hypothetical protein [Yaniella sp.]
MRNFLAVLLALVAGITASVGLVAWKLDGVINVPEQVQEMFGSGEAADQLKSVVPEALGKAASESIDIGVVGDAVNAAVSRAAGEITSHEEFDEAWSESLEQTRGGWVEEIHSLRDRMDTGESIPENSTDAQLQLRLDPVAEVGVSVIDDAVAQVPGSSGGLGLEPELRVDMATPPVSMLTAEQVVLAEELITLWPVVLVLAGIVLLMALLVASHGNRWIVWLIAGLLTAISGVALKVGLALIQNQVLDTAEDTPQLSLARPFLRAFQEWADPQLIVLMAIGFGFALLGILGGFISANRQRTRY